MRCRRRTLVQPNEPYRVVVRLSRNHTVEPTKSLILRRTLGEEPSKLNLLGLALIIDDGTPGPQESHSWPANSPIFCWSTASALPKVSTPYRTCFRACEVPWRTISRFAGSGR